MSSGPLSSTTNAVRIPVDRVHAAVRALWRLLTSGLVIGLAYLLGIQIGDWSLFWEQQPATFAAIAIVIAGLALAGVGVGIGGGRWLMLAVWPKHVGLRIDEKAIDVALGPFGSESVPWANLTCNVAEGFDADMLSQIGDDAFTPVMLDAQKQRDLYAWIQSHSGVAPETLTHALRPYFEARVRNA
ncbi:MAG: hypothetical protein H6818_18205 [Phycisphaerales bacterium]|nr:hypothetical protein [Phycisphaerales bacterium]MCB9864823.1 hypothetical protein [Phycisphaerales bacterium]